MKHAISVTFDVYTAYVYMLRICNYIQEGFGGSRISDSRKHGLCGSDSVTFSTIQCKICSVAYIRLFNYNYERNQWCDFAIRYNIIHFMYSTHVASTKLIGKI